MNQSRSTLPLAASLVSVALSAVACTATSEEGDYMMDPLMTDTTGMGGGAAAPMATGPGTVDIGPMPSATVPTGGGGAPVDDGTQTPAPTTMGGAGGMDGTGGAMVEPEPEITPIAFNNDEPFRFEIPCMFDQNGQDAQNSFCHPSNVCWLTNTKSNEKRTGEIPIGGDPNLTYNVTLRIRGVLEPKRYPESCVQIQSQEANPKLRICQGTNDEGPSTFDTWKLTIDSPAQIFYLNSENDGHGHAVFTIDTTFIVQMKGQTKARMFFDDVNGGLISNCPEFTHPEIEEKPYNGNWAQLDVVEWKVAE